MDDMKITLKKEKILHPPGIQEKIGLSEKQRRILKFFVPECYTLDFGYVVPGRVPSHTMDITNIGDVPDSVRANHKMLAGTGFKVEFKKVKDLPVGNAHRFTVTFDPQGAQLPQGKTFAVLPIQADDGIVVVQLNMTAVVATPGCTVSTEILEFDSIPCGMCQIKTVQLINSEPVPCRWRTVEKAIALNKKNKQQQPPPLVFEVEPSSGALSPGNRVNVQIRFTPLEEEFYSKCFVVRVAENNHEVSFTAQGKGKRVHLSFTPQVLQLGPCLPFSGEVEAEITVNNPCSFPIEFYSLELDEQYLEEEKVLRLMQGYDKNRKLLLPCRFPGDGLPPELLDFYQHFCSSHESDVEKTQTCGFKNNITATEIPTFLLSELNKEGSYEELGRLHLDPVSKAIARHMGVDVSPDSLAALNRRGIAIIVYGAPKIDTSSTAGSLAQYYGGALLSVDAVVTEVLLGASPASLAAKQHFERGAKCLPIVADSLVRTNLPRSAESEGNDRASSSVSVSTFSEEPEVTEAVALCLGEDGSMLKPLPEPLLYEILTQRFKSRDCHRGIVINGLSSAFTTSLVHTLQVVLKALHNRKHIYVVNLTDPYSSTLSIEEAQKEAEDAQQQVTVSERQCLLKSDEECKTVPEEKKQQGQDRSKVKQEDLIHHKDEAPKTTLNKEHQKNMQSPTKRLMDENASLVNEVHAHHEIQVQVDHVLQHWERVQGVLLVPVPGEEETTNTKNEAPFGKGRGKKARKDTSQQKQNETTDDKLRLANAIPQFAINLKEMNGSALEVLRNFLPSADEILDDMGFGTSGPPIPPPVIFSLVPFPQNRTLSQVNKCFTLVTSTDKDEPAEKEENSKKPLKAKVSGKKMAKGASHVALSSLNVEDQSQLSVKPKSKKSLTSFRWTVPANGEITLRMRFFSETPGVFEQIFNFGIVDTQIQYRLLCQGTCTYPSICKDYMTLFASSNKAQHERDGLQRAYIVDPGYFEFGPLLACKTRDKYKRSIYPENTEKLLIHNTSGLEVDIQFSFQNDTQATTYLLDPPAMTLKPEEKQNLVIWAYPTKVGQFKDRIVCNIKDNPEPLVIDVSCWGVRPRLELESKTLSFDKTITHRRVSRIVNLHNKTALPVSWRLQGVDELGDSFSVPQDQGLVPPYSTLPVTLHFKAIKPSDIKKSLRLEVSDVVKILGIVQSEIIAVTAEAYEVSLNIEPDCVTFETMKVFDEAKQTLTIRNLGKYEIVYKIELDQTHLNRLHLENSFSIAPQGGKVKPHGKSVTVQITFRPRAEIHFEMQPILLCQVIEPNTGERGENIAVLVTNVSVEAVFSRYKITPASEINFGPLAFGCKKTQTFTIENKGVFKTTFLISNLDLSEKSVGDKQSVPGGKGKISNLLTMGVFSLHPCYGEVLPGAQREVIVDCTGDQPGDWEENVIIDICHRDPSDHPDGMPFRLMTEIFKPGIVTDSSFIFEEHFLCHNSDELSSPKFANAETIYVIKENKLIFNNILVGQTSKARIKLTNNTKVPCCLCMALRNLGSKMEKGIIFHLSHTSLSIPGQSHCFVEITFTPLVATTYKSVFEASMEGACRMTPTRKNNILEFDILGEGIVSHVSVICPAIQNSSGDLRLYLQRTFVGQKRTQSMVLLNDGKAPVQVEIDMPDKSGVFSLKAAPGNNVSSISTVRLENSSDPELQSAYRAITQLNINDKVEFEISFCSKIAQKHHTNMFVKHEYEVITINVFGEAHQEAVSLEKIRPTSNQMSEDGNHQIVDFGHCHVGVPHQESFIMVNHTKDKMLKFEWSSAGPKISLSHQVGHLHAGCCKEMSVILSSSTAISLTSKPLKCRVTQLKPLEQALESDDQQKTVSTTRSSAISSPLSSKHEVTKADLESSCSEVDGWYRDLEVLINAVCEDVKLSCNTDSIIFEDTMVFHSTIQKVQISNEGQANLEFSWKIQMDDAQPDETITPPPTARSTTVSRANSGVSLLSIHPQLAPFTVEPSIGVIKPKSTQEFNICFTPLEVFQFEGILTCSIPNMQKNDRLPTVTVRGCGSVSYCHFDIEESGYISERVSSEFGRPVDPETRVVKFIVVGVPASFTKCFSVLNPTNQPYSFQWRCEDTDRSSFQCLTPSGSLQAKERAEVRFKYVCKQNNTEESSWSFVIDTPSVTVPFLLVGSTRAPLIYLDRALINFGELLVGSSAEQTVHLVNGEELPFRFSVVDSSLLSEDQRSHLGVLPKCGRLAPKERLAFSVFLAPRRQGYVSFRMLLQVERMQEPLGLTVKADCISVNALVQIQNPNGGLRELQPDHPDRIDFKKVGVSEQSCFHFVVSNLTSRDMNVAFDIIGPRNLLPPLRAEPTRGALRAGKQLGMTLWFCPLYICNLEDTTLRITVAKVLTYTLDIKGRGVAPNLEFSFNKHNFGKCFLHSPGVLPPTQTLLVKNKGKRDISLQCQFESTSYLRIGFEPSVLAPGADLKIPITFYPQAERQYREMLNFTLNSSVTRHVEVTGQGIELKLDIENRADKRIDLESPAPGKNVKKRVVLVNRSSLNLCFSLHLDSNTPLDIKDLSVTPTHKVVLQTGKSCPVDIQFSPRQQVPKIKAELQAKIQGFFHPLLSIRASCKSYSRWDRAQDAESRKLSSNISGI